MKDFSLKYKIQEKLEQLNYKDYESAVKVLPKALKISSATFHKYMNVRIYESYGISADHLARLAKFFDCSMENMLNYTAPDLKLRGMKKHGKIDIKNEFYDLWVWDNLTWNMKLWEKVFYQYLDDKNIDDLLCKIREKFAD